jgi:hypothetical protein
VQRNQRGFGALMVSLAREQRMRSGEHLQCKLACALLVTPLEVARPFPYRWLNEFERDFAASENGFERATCPAVFETARGALLGHRLAAFDPGAIGWCV